MTHWHPYQFTLQIIYSFINSIIIQKSAELAHFNDVHHPKLHPSTQLNKQLCWRFFYICGSQYAEPKKQLQPKTLTFQPKWTNAKNLATELMSTSAFAVIPNKNVEKDTQKTKNIGVIKMQCHSADVHYPMSTHIRTLLCGKTTAFFQHPKCIFTIKESL